MLHTFKNGQGSVVLRVKLLNSSVSTGAGLTGLTSASSGLIIGTIADNEATATAYTVAGSTIEGITTLGTYAAPTATKCRFKEVDATNHPGVYELQFADARFAVASAKSLLVSLSGATNLAQSDFVVQLQSDDPHVAKPANFNLTSIDASGRLDIIKVAGTTQTARDIGASVLLSNGTGTGQVKLASGYVAMTWADIAAPTTTVNLSGTTIAITQKVDVETIKTNPVANGGTVTFPSNATLASTTNITGGTITTATNLTNAPTSGDLTAAMKASVNAEADTAIADAALATAANLATVAGYLDTEIAAILAAVDTEVAAIKAKTDNLPAAPAATGDQMALTAAAVDAILDDAADGSTTVRQLLRGFASALLGKASGLSTTTAVYRDLADTKARITATVDADGNRTAVTLDLT